MSKTKPSPTARIIAALQGRIENDDFDDKRTVPEAKELELRAHGDALERQFKKQILDDLFPDRKKGKLYQEITEEQEIIDY